MMFTALGVIMIVVTVASVIMRLLPLGDLSLWAIRVSVPMITLFMSALGFLVYGKLKARGNLREAKIWPLFSSGGLFLFCGFISHTIADLTPDKMIEFSFIGNIFLTMAYIVLITSLWRLSKIFVSNSKLSIWLPIIISTIFFIVSAYILFFMGLVDMFIKVGFMLFVVMDIITVFLCFAIYQRTQGGALSMSFTFIAVGIGFMTIYQITAILLESMKMLSFHHPIQIFLVICLCIDALGFDLRYMIEQRMAKH